MITGLQQGEGNEPRTALVVFAHPDDAEFMCGGTVAKWCAEGWEVVYVAATSGDKGSRDPQMTRQHLAAVREREQRAAARVLGVRECIFLGYPDGFLDPTLELRGQIVRLIRKYRPDVVLTWDGFRRSFNHRDHRVIGTVTYDAIYPCANDPLYYPEHLQEEGLAPHRPAELWLAGSDEPDYHVDVTEYFARKLEAALCHVSQMRRTREELEQVWRERMRRGEAQAGQERLFEAFRRIQFQR